MLRLSGLRPGRMGVRVGCWQAVGVQQPDAEPMTAEPSLARVVAPSHREHVATVSTTMASYQPSPGSSRAITTWPPPISPQVFGRVPSPFWSEPALAKSRVVAAEDG